MTPKPAKTFATLIAVLAAAAFALAASPTRAADQPTGYFQLVLDGYDCGIFAAATWRGDRLVLGRGTIAPEVLDRLAGEKRQDPEVVMYSGSGEPVARYGLVDAWLVKWELGELDASKNEVSIETLELAATEVRRL